MQSVKHVLAAVMLVAVQVATVAHAAPEATAAHLAGYEGTYAYRDGLTLYIVTDGSRLVAVIDQSKYLLTPTGPDLFRNPAGENIPFERDAQGRVTGFRENNDPFARLSATVPDAPRLLLSPRGKSGAMPEVYHYTAPPKRKDGIAVGKAGGAFAPAIAGQLVNGVIDGKYADVHSLLVYRHDALVLESYFYGIDRDQPHETRSLSKSVITLLAGAAVDRGLLRLDEPALARLGYADVQNPDPRKARITLKDLLANQSGLACNEHDNASPGKETKLFDTGDWVKSFFDVPMAADPGTTGSYCSGGFYAAGKMIEKASGKPLPEFAQEVLFGPLGMERNTWRWNFTLDRSQRNAFGQVFLRPRDMLKLGILMQDRGVWHGRQVVSPAWIDAMAAHQSDVDDSAYGLGVWHRWYRVPTPGGDRRVDTIMLSGNGGQKVYLVPALDLIVATTGNAYFVEAPVNEMLVNVILPPLLAEKDGAKQGE